MKAFADNRCNVAKIMNSVFDRTEKIGKERKCWLPAFSPFYPFSPFPTMFSKAFFFIVVKILN